MNTLKEIMGKSRILGVVCVCVITFFASSVSAALVVYTNETEWLAAVSGVVTENFTGTTPGQLSVGSNDIGLFNITLDDLNNYFGLPTIAQDSLAASGFDRWLIGVVFSPYARTQLFPQSMSFDFDSPVIGFAADWWGAGAGGKLTMTINGTVIKFSDYPSSGFLGVVDSTPFTQVDFGLEFMTRQYDEFAVDNVRLAPALTNHTPDCSQAVPSIDIIWPADHKYVSISILGVTDPDGDSINITVDAISQDEPVDTVGDGKFVPDGEGIGTSTALIRAERSGSKKVLGNGRVYHILFTADDGQGGRCSGEVTVGVPHDRGKIPVDDGAVYDSTYTAL
jgi:hypothetical protein